MSFLQLLQIMVYDIVDVSICTVLVLLPFRDQLCSRKKLCLLAAVLYTLVVGSRVLSQTGIMSITAISVIRLILYILLFRLAVHSDESKRLFVLMVMLNYVSFIMVLFHYLASALFASEFAANPYSFYSSFLMAGVFLFCFPLIHWMMNTKIRPLMNSPENKKMWNYIWMIPATFCVIYHYNILTNNGVMAFSSDWYNMVFSLVITAGSLLVTYMIITLVEESNSNLKLKAENYQLMMQAVQYESLKSRMEETRIARHDLRHNMKLIGAYLEDKNYEGLKDYMKQYFCALSLNSPIIYCENYALNAVITYYEDVARKNEVEFKADVIFTGADGLSDTDAVVLMGNLLENSVEACSRQISGRRYINLHLRQEGHTIIITIDNSYNGIIHEGDGGFLSSKSSYTGIGVISIQKLAEKYHGVAKFEYNGSEFRTSVMLNP